MEHCRDRIQDALEDNEEDRLLEEAEVMAREAGEYLVENDNAEDDIEGEDHALQILLNMRGYFIADTDIFIIHCILSNKHLQHFVLLNVIVDNKKIFTK